MSRGAGCVRSVERDAGSVSAQSGPEHRDRLVRLLWPGLGLDRGSHRSHGPAGQSHDLDHRPLTTFALSCKPTIRAGMRSRFVISAHSLAFCCVPLHERIVVVRSGSVTSPFFGWARRGERAIPREYRRCDGLTEPAAAGRRRGPVRSPRTHSLRNGLGRGRGQANSRCEPSARRSTRLSRAPILRCRVAVRMRRRRTASRRSSALRARARDA